VPRLLFVTAAAAERDAVLGGRAAAQGFVSGTEVLRVSTPAGLMDVLATGVGSVAAAVEVGALVNEYDLVINCGIAGGFPAAPVGSVVVASSVVHADLGTETESGFTSMADLGWGPIRFALDQPLVELVSTRTGGQVGAILTVSTVTGTQARADALLHAHPDALAEAMEGIGAFRAAARAKVPFVEVRTISNPVGPRDRDAWQIGDALLALTTAVSSLVDAPFKVPTR